MPTTVLQAEHLTRRYGALTAVAIIDHGRLLVLDTPEALKQTVGTGDVLEVDIAVHALRPRLCPARPAAAHPRRRREDADDG